MTPNRPQEAPAEEKGVVEEDRKYVDGSGPGTEEDQVRCGQQVDFFMLYKQVMIVSITCFKRESL